MTWTTISGTSEEDSGDGFARIVEIAFGLTHFVILSILGFFFFFGCFFDLKKKKDREREGGNEVFVAVLFGGKIYIINIYIFKLFYFFFFLFSLLLSRRCIFTFHFSTFLRAKGFFGILGGFFEVLKLAPIVFFRWQCVGGSNFHFCPLCFCGPSTSAYGIFKLDFFFNLQL